MGAKVFTQALAAIVSLYFSKPRRLLGSTQWPDLQKRHRLLTISLKAIQPWSFVTDGGVPDEYGAPNPGSKRDIASVESREYTALNRFKALGVWFPVCPQSR